MGVSGVFRVALGLAALAGASPVAAQGRGGCPVSVREETVTALSPRGEILTMSGAVFLVWGVRLADGAGAGAARAALTGLAGRTVRIAARRPEDRWGRIAGDVAGPEGDVALALLERGLALADPGDRDGHCRPDLRLREDQARERGLGLWSEAGGGALDAEDLPALLAQAGRFAIVEGRVRGVGERRFVTYLNFGTDWSQDFTVTIRKRTWTKLAATGMDSAGLRGRRIRVRGLIQNRGGPAVTIDAAEAIELLDEGRRRRP